MLKCGNDARRAAGAVSRDGWARQGFFFLFFSRRALWLLSSPFLTVPAFRAEVP